MAIFRRNLDHVPQQLGGEQRRDTASVVRGCRQLSFEDIEQGGSAVPAWAIHRPSPRRVGSIQAVARPSQVDDRRHKMAIVDRSTCRSAAVCRAADQLTITEHHIYDIWPPAS